MTYCQGALRVGDCCSNKGSQRNRMSQGKKASVAGRHSRDDRPFVADRPSKTDSKETKDRPGLRLRNDSDASIHLDAVRGLAALAVFLGHGRAMFLSKRAAPTSPSPLASTFSTTAAPAADQAVGDFETVGHEAVIVFFVLSGFFVGGSVVRAFRRQNFSWSRYTFQRLTRLWIVLIPALLLGWALDWGGMHWLGGSTSIYSGPTGQEEVWPGLVNRLNVETFFGNLLFLQTIFLQPFGTNASLWSLSYEFWYYVLFPIVLIACAGSGRLMLRILSALVAAGMLYLFGTELAKYFVVWLFGVAIAVAPPKLTNQKRRLAILAFGAVFLVALVAMLRAKLNLYMSDLILSAALAPLVWAILHLKTSTLPELYRKMARGLSNISFTLYAVHMPILALVSAILMPQWHTLPMSARSLVMMAGVYGVVFAAAWLIYLMFEKRTDDIRTWISGSAPNE